jgi:hypothetical protein
MMHSAAGGLWFEDAQFGIALRSTGSETGTSRTPSMAIG